MPARDVRMDAIPIEESVERPPIPLYPSLGSPDQLDAFKKAGRTISFALSPRGNSFVGYESCRALALNILRIEQKDFQSPPTNLKHPRILYFAQWEKIRREDTELFVESYVTFDSLQRVTSGETDNKNILSQNSELIKGCWKALGYYVDNVYAHLDRLGLSENFNETGYNHWSAIGSTVHLLQVLFTSESGITASTLVGEELLYWLNAQYVAPTSEEGPALDLNEKPWLDEGFWGFVVRCILRGIPKSAIYFLNKLITQHPSRILRRLMTDLVPILQKHPRSREYDTEDEFVAAHRRWKEQLVKNYRRHVDELEDDDGTNVRRDQAEEGEWRSGVEQICAILEGDREALFAMCKEQGWGWREALGVWGVWYDVRFTREALPSTLPLILKRLPVNEANPDELVQSALGIYDTQSVRGFCWKTVSSTHPTIPHQAMQGARRWDLWFATHSVDVLDKLGELDDGEVQKVTGLSLRSNLLIEYAEHLYTDPSLWRVTLEYLGACGAEGKALVAEVIMRIPVDVSLPSQTTLATAESVPKAPSTADKGKGKAKEDTDLDMILDDAEGNDQSEGEAKAWKDWEDKILKIVDVCKDYGLEDVLYSVCRSISQALIRRGLYGRAVQYSVMARDGRGVGRIADLLLQVYITKGADEFRTQVATIPTTYLLASTNPVNPSNDIFASNLQFIARYAEFHEMFANGEKKDAARFLVVMLGAGIVPKWWWGVVLLDAGGMLDGMQPSLSSLEINSPIGHPQLFLDSDMVLSREDAYELLRHLEEIYTRAEQGNGADYLGALDHIMRGSPSSSTNDDTAITNQPVDVDSALAQLQVVRLAIARYLARCAVAGY
ncbi:hypothetical protein DL93DRAFT_2100127 [Clavulina sp. PMI_390]|nr:hypothetical protein DL93DRAFT_2100127 [Clavulina sp. PMI_390]